MVGKLKKAISCCIICNLSTKVAKQCSHVAADFESLKFASISSVKEDVKYL